MSVNSRLVIVAAAAAVLVGSAVALYAQVPPAAAPASAARPVATVPGMPPVPDALNLYSETTAGKLSAATAGALERVYVPNRSENTVMVIDPATLKVVDKFKVGINPQHVVCLLYTSDAADE